MSSPRLVDPDSPAALVAAAGGGDLDAFARIVRIHHEGMTRTALLVTGDLDLAAAAVAASWATAWPRLAGGLDPERLTPWLASIAVEEALYLLRDARVPPPEPAPRDLDLVRILAGLRAGDRALLARHHLADLDPAQLARPPFHTARRIRSRLAELASIVAGSLADGAMPDPDPDPVAVAARARERLRAHVAVPIRPVHADDAARRARAETAVERSRLVSVAVSAVAGLLVAAAPYLLPLAFGHG